MRTAAGTGAAAHAPTNVATARGPATGLHVGYQGVDYFFCGKGCKLDFGEDPERYLAPGYVPSM
jgi:YHS domain-containing protein